MPKTMKALREAVEAKMETAASKLTKHLASCGYNIPQKDVLGALRGDPISSAAKAEDALKKSGVDLQGDFKKLSKRLKDLGCTKDEIASLLSD